MIRRSAEIKIIHTQFVQMCRSHLAIKRVIEKSSFVVIKSAARFANPRLPGFFRSQFSAGIVANELRSDEKTMLRTR